MTGPFPHARRGDSGAGRCRPAKGAGQLGWVFILLTGGWLFFLSHYFSDGTQPMLPGSPYELEYEQLSAVDVGVRYHSMRGSALESVEPAIADESSQVVHAEAGAQGDSSGDSGGQCPGGIVALTYASHRGRDDRFCRTLESGIRNQIPLHVLGWGTPWEGLSQKLRASHEAVSALPRDCIVLFTDGFDVLFLDNVASIRKSFVDMNVPLLFAGECGCWPQFERGVEVCTKKYPTAPTLYRYLNSGAWMGYAYKAQDLLGAILQHGASTDFNKLNDQELVSDLYMQGNPHNITLDHYARVFQCVHSTDAPLPHCHPEEHLFERDGYWYNRYTDSRPGIFHFNGGGKRLHLPMERRVWYKRAEYNAQDDIEAVLQSELFMGDRMRSLKEVCPPDFFRIGS